MSALSARFLFNQLVVYGLGDAAVKALGLVSTVIFTRVFTASDYGTISLVGSFVAVLNVFSGLGLSGAAQRDYFATTRHAKRVLMISTAYWGAVGFASAVALLGCVISPLMSYLTFHSFNNWELYVLATLTIPATQGLAFCQDTIRIHFRPWRFTTVAIIGQLGQIVLAVLFVVGLDVGVYGLFAGILFGTLLAFALGSVWISHELRLTFSASMFRRFAWFGAPLVLGGLAFPLFMFVDRFVLEYFRGASAVGHLAVALSVAQAMGLISGSFGKAWNAVAWKLRHQNAQYRGIYADLLLYLIAVFAVAAVGIAAFAPEIVGILAPPAFAEASIAVAPLTIYMLANVSIQITAAGISISGKTSYLTAVIWIAVIGNVVLDFALIPVWGIFGAALATAIAETLMSIGLAAVSQRLHPLPYDYSRLAGCMGLLTVFLGLSYLLQPGWSVFAIVSKLGFVALFVGLLVATTIVSLKRLTLTAQLLSDTGSSSPSVLASAEDVTARRVSV